MNEPSRVVNLTIDGKAIAVPKGTTVFHAAKQLGVEIPVFCYLDRMPAFGACRVCMVEVEKMGKPQTSCTLEAMEGMVVKTQTTMAIEARKNIIEFLLLNHPLDCPVCDRGGECPLQEHTLNHGPGQSRFYEEKRHFKKPWALGPVLMLDRERCIVCARCTRFGDVVAGDHALELLERGYRTEVGTPDGGPAESKFIGNTIMICPVGALTSQVYRFRARPWDNSSTNTSCTLCPVGCSMALDSRDGEVMRTRSCENKSLNDIWLCDKGWFGYEFVYHPERLSTPLIRKGGELRPASWEEALNLIADKITAAKPNGRLAGWGGNPLTVEENYLFQQLMREVVGVNHLDHRIGMPIFSLEEEGLTAGMEMEIGACEELSDIYLFGLDITEEFPVIWLRLKQAINKGANVHFFGHFSPEVSAYFKTVVLHPPGQEIETIQKLNVAGGGGKEGALFVGKQYLGMPNRAQILLELANLKAKHPSFSLNVMEGRGNSIGACFAGMRPDLGPGGKKIEPRGFSALQLIEKMATEGWDYLHVAGTDPAKKYPSKLWKEARDKLGFLVVQDLFLTETAKQADLVLPTLSFIEKGGSFINVDLRVQSLLPGKEIPENLYSDGEIFTQIAEKLNRSLHIDPAFLTPKQIKRGPLQTPQKTATLEGYPLHATFAHSLFDFGIRMQHNPGLLQLVKEPKIRVHPSEALSRNFQEGDVVQVTYAGNSLSGRLALDFKVSLGTVVLPLGFEQIRVQDLKANLLNGLPVKIEKLTSSSSGLGLKILK